MSMPDVASWGATSDASSGDLRFRTGIGIGNQPPQDRYEEAEEEVPLGSLSSLDEARALFSSAPCT